MSEEFIQSRQNPRVKALQKLQDRAGRRKLGLFAIEGLRELSRAVETIEVDEIYFCPEFFKSEGHSAFVDKIRAEGRIELCRLSEGACLSCAPIQISKQQSADKSPPAIIKW